VFPFLNCLFIILTPAWNNLVLLAFFLVWRRGLYSPLNMAASKTVHLSPDAARYDLVTWCYERGKKQP
jgi:hypothetical protein